MRAFFAIFLQTLAYVLLTLVLLLAVGALLLQVPAVQTRLVQEVAQRVSAKLQFPVDIGRVSIKWLDAVTLEDVRIRDRQQRAMIDVGRLEVNYNLRNLIDSSNSHIRLDEVLLYQPSVWLVKDRQTGALNINEFIDRINELLAKDTTQPNRPNNNIPFQIEQGTVVDGTFRYDDPREPVMRSPLPVGQQPFDYNHFTLHNIGGDVTNFLALGDTIALDVRRLRAIDKPSGLSVRRLDTRFLYCAKKMEMAELYARINGSVVRDYVAFHYVRPSAFGHFNSEVDMRGRLRDCYVRAEDLGRFSSYIRGLREAWRLSGDFRGTVNDFVMQHTDLRFGPTGRSRLAGDLAFRGLPDVARTTVDLAFSPSAVTLADIRQYYPEPAFTNVVEKFGTLAFEARFTGAFDDFRSRGTFRTALGNVVVRDLAMTFPDNAPSTYTADVVAEQVALGTLVDRPDLLGRLDGEGRITGQGFSLSNASVDVDGRVSRFGLSGYDYRNLSVRGNLQRAFFSGQVSLRDTNLRFVADGEFDLRGPRNHFDLRGYVGRANLHELGLLTDSLVVQTGFDVELTGNTFDEMVGDARFRNAQLSRLGAAAPERSLAIDTLSIFSAITPAEPGQATPVGRRFIQLSSDFADARLEGNFRFARTADDLRRLLREYRLYFFGDVASRAAYYRQKGSQAGAERYGIDYVMTTKNAAPLLAFFSPTVYVAPQTRIDGRFTLDNTSLLTATLRSDSVRLGQYAFGPSEIDLTTSKFTNSEEVIASAVITSQRQQLGPLAPTEKLAVDAFWDVDHIDFTGRLQQVNSTNYADLRGELRFKGDALDLTFRRSVLRVLDNTWTLNPESLIRKVGRDYTVRNLALSNGPQLITVSGKLSDDPAEELYVEARNFQLESLEPVLNSSLRGQLNGSLTLRDLYETAIVESEMTIADLMLQDVPIGNVAGDGVWDPVRKRLNIDARVKRDGADVLAITGTYAPAAPKNALALNADFTNADLRVLEPFARGLISRVGGTASGRVAISGTPSAPKLDGALDVRRGQVVFDYLKAEFAFDDKIYFSDGEISAKRLVVRDADGNAAVVRGGVYHDNFRYFTLGFDAELKNFKILNTTARDNSLFYGTAVVTGRAELFGPLDNLTIRANVASNRGTKIYIPLDGATNVASQDVVRFVNRSTPTVARTDSLRSGQKSLQVMGSDLDLSGVKMDFNFDITPDAYCEIQLDRQTGDIIKAYGSGHLDMAVDTKGEFTMTGTYEIERGDYTFTFENVINKRFQIRPDSRISWTGDPYGALLDVTAAYTQYTSLRPLDPTLANPNPNVPAPAPTADQNRRYPVDLLIRLTGLLTKPDIGFDLKVKEYPVSPTFRQYITAFENRIQSNDQELNRQVSSLLLFNQLLPEGTGLFDAGNVNAGVANSVGELLSNRISQLASNLNEKLDVGISLGGLNQNVINNLQLRFSYRFLNDRFRISRDGGFTYGQNQTSAASLLGEWTLEYWITPDGRLRAKVYNRNQQNVLGQFNAFGTAALTTSGGVSFLYTRTFNRLFGGREVPPIRQPLVPQLTPGLAPVSIRRPVVPPVGLERSGQ